MMAFCALLHRVTALSIDAWVGTGNARIDGESNKHLQYCHERGKGYVLSPLLFSFIMYWDRYEEVSSPITCIDQYQLTKLIHIR